MVLDCIHVAGIWNNVDCGQRQLVLQATSGCRIAALRAVFRMKKQKLVSDAVQSGSVETLMIEFQQVASIAALGERLRQAPELDDIDIAFAESDLLRT